MARAGRRLERAWRLAAGLSTCAVAGCVPADEAGRLGSVQFTLVASEGTIEGVTTADGWGLTFDRTVLGFKTMTIGRIGVDDACAYRGRGASSDVVFDPKQGLVQTFNGIKPVECPDVGIIFGPPDAETTLGSAVPSTELVALASGVPAHAIVEVTATDVRDFGGVTSNPRKLEIQLRLDSARTSTRFGGCRSPTRTTSTTIPTRGVRVVAGERDEATVSFAAEALFRDAVSTGAKLWVAPFQRADADGDGIVTMTELDALRLRDVIGGPYRLPNGSVSGSFGDYVRVLFRYAFTFRDAGGQCIGNEPGSEEGGQPAPSP